MIRYVTRFTAVFTVAFLIGPALSQLDGAHARTGYAGVEAAPALWKVESDNATVWLFGTFHLLPPDLQWRSAAVNAAFASAGTLWLEADATSEQAQMDMTMLVAERGMNPPGVTLSSMLDDETDALLHTVAAQLGAPVAMLQPMRPWLASLMLAVQQLHVLGFDPNAGADAVLSAAAKAAGKRLDYFETVSDQIGFFADVPLPAQLQWLEQTLREVDEMPELLDDMTIAWLTGDVAVLDEVFNQSMREDSPELYDILMTQRNRAWLTTIVDLLERGGTHFVAVGAGHLPGRDGLVALLREAGFEPTR